MKGFLCEKPSFLPFSLERGRGGSSKPVFWGGGRRETTKEGKKNGQVVKVWGCQGCEYLFF